MPAGLCYIHNLGMHITCSILRRRLFKALAPQAPFGPKPVTTYKGPSHQHTTHCLQNCAQCYCTT
jgi:hypothetical protein